jgi:carboxymethylenebutenolidase
MGGGHSLQLAVHQPRLAVAVVYYGRLVTDESTLRAIQAPVLGLFGEKDRGIPARSVRAFAAAMKKLGKPAEVHLYPDAGHAFANPTRASYRKAAAKDAHGKTLAFLGRHLWKE